MSRIVVSLMALLVPLAGLGLTAGSGQEDIKPVAVVSVGSYEQAMEDVAMIGRLTDNPHLADGVEAIGLLLTRGQGIAGLDTRRPCGAVALTNGSKIAGYAFLPVTDLDELLTMVGRLTEVEHTSDGIHKVRTKDGPLYVAEKTPGWAIVSKHRRVIGLAEGDPASMVEGLCPEYDLAARVYVENIPEHMRRAAIAKMHRDHQRDAKRRPAESEHEHAMRKAVGDEIIKLIETSIDEIEQCTLGWSLDHETEDASVELTLKAKPGSAIANATNQLGEMQSRFTGFAAPEATLSANWVGAIPTTKQQMFDAIFETAREQLKKQIALEHEEQGKPEDETKLAQQIVADVIDVLDETIREGKTDGGVAVLLGPGRATVAAGVQMVDVEKLEDWARKIAAFATADHPALGQMIKLDAGKAGDVRFHTVTLPIGPDEENREKMVELLGPNIEVAVGVGPDALYLSAGRDALGVLKEAIARSASAARETVQPLHSSLDVRSLMGFVAEYGDTEDEREKAAAVAALLDEIEDDARFDITAVGVEDGVKYRLRATPGVMKLVGRLFVTPQLD